jgi:hypothetical protein
LSKVVIAAALIVAALAAGKQNHVFERAGVVHECRAIAAPLGEEADAHWQACKQGWLDGYPDLSLESCDRMGRTPGREFWRCPAPLSGSLRAS